MWAAIGAFLQLLYLIFKNKFEKDADEKARKDALHAEAMDAIKNGDLSKYTSVFDQLRS